MKVKQLYNKEGTYYFTVTFYQINEVFKDTETI